jgi:ribosomal protein S1
MKLQKIGKQIKAKVYSVSKEKKIVELTMKPTFMKKKEEYLMIDDEEAQPGKKFYGMIVGNNEFGYIIKFFNGILGFLQLKDVEESVLKGKTMRPG